jgi:triphosphoribosyl-dephospho-CoA synthase
MWIGECLLKALLMEVSAWPKPGLVTPHSQGAHKDMDIWLFITSIGYCPCFSACAHAGENHQGSPGNSLQQYVPLAFNMKIRCCGQHSRLILSAAFFFRRGSGDSGRMAFRARENLSYHALSQCVAELCRDLCRRDFSVLAERPAQTHGEKLYVGFGITGVRGEAEQGFPLVCQIGLPALHQALDNGLAWREALIHTLLTLMAHCDDTTVLFSRPAGAGGNEAICPASDDAGRNV